MAEKLRDTNIDIKIKNEPRGKVRRNNTIIRFTGIITGMEMNYGFIKRDEIGDIVYFYRYHDNYDNWDIFKKNVKVNFILSFNYRGAIALDLKLY